MASNMPILWQNALMQYHDCPIAAKAWVWASETRGVGMQYASDKYANEVKKLVETLNPMLTSAQKIHDASDEVTDDLLRFILKRHANDYFGGNVKMWWER